VDSKFWSGLIKGNIAEAKVANYLRARGFNVWQIGSYRLPVDLLVWDNKFSFWVQVKMRTEHLILVNMSFYDVLNIRADSSYPILLVLDYKNKFYADYMDYRELSKTVQDKTGFMFIEDLSKYHSRKDLLSRYKREIEEAKKKIITLKKKAKALKESNNEISLY